MKITHPPRILNFPLHRGAIGYLHLHVAATRRPLVRFCRRPPLARMCNAPQESPH
jgi:hypothetical protein